MAGELCTPLTFWIEWRSWVASVPCSSHQLWAEAAKQILTFGTSRFSERKDEWWIVYQHNTLPNHLLAATNSLCLLISGQPRHVPNGYHSQQATNSPGVTISQRQSKCTIFDKRCWAKSAGGASGPKSPKLGLLAVSISDGAGLRQCPLPKKNPRKRRERDLVGYTHWSPMGLACFLGSRKSLQSHKQIRSFASFDVASSYRKFENTRHTLPSNSRKATGSAEGYHLKMTLWFPIEPLSKKKWLLSLSPATSSISRISPPNWFWQLFQGPQVLERSFLEVVAPSPERWKKRFRKKNPASGIPNPICWYPDLSWFQPIPERNLAPEKHEASI